MPPDPMTERLAAASRLAAAADPRVQCAASLSVHDCAECRGDARFVVSLRWPGEATAALVQGDSPEDAAARAVKFVELRKATLAEAALRN